MKKMLTLIGLVSLVFFALKGTGAAEDFLGAPIMPGGTTVRADKRVLEKIYDLPKGQVLDYYNLDLAPSGE
jgi:hypothetical protein